MAHSTPPSKRPTKAPSKTEKATSSKPPAGKIAKVPPRRQTMEVQMAWLDAEDKGARREARKKPPRLPGAARTLPPMPLITPKTQPPPPRNHTMEVEMNWVELVEEKKRAKAEEDEHAKAEAAARSPNRRSTVRLPAAQAASQRPMPVEEATKPRPKPRKPIPRED